MSFISVESCESDSSASISSATWTGKQGKIILVTKNGELVVEKQSLHIDYTLELEYKIGKVLNGLNSDHFCKYYSLISDNKISNSSSKKLYMEWIPGTTLHLTETTDDEHISLVGRTLVMNAVLNEELNISHNDLHACNVLIKPCNVDACVYVFPDGEELSAYSYNKSPVIIDFGMSFPGIACNTMMTPIYHTDIGYFPHESDKFTDVRRLLFTSRNVLPDVKAMLNDYYLSTGGWFERYTFPDLLREIYRELDITGSDSSDTLISLFITHIRLPLRKIKRTKNLKTAFDALEYTLDLNDVKNILDGNINYLEKRYTSEYIKKLRIQCKTIILALNNFIFREVSSMSLKKKQFYDASTLHTSRDIARILLSHKIKYDCKTTISVYDVKNRKTIKIILTLDECNKVNSGNLKFIDIIKTRCE